MNSERNRKISKRLSYILRHRPDSVGLELGDAGWVGVETLLAALARNGVSVNRDLLNEVVEENDKRRFELDAGGSKIRARQGHSLEIDLGYRAVEPPERLYHGTATHHLPSIRENGIHKAKRHHVHLSVDRAMMVKVGSRHGKPAVVAVDAAAMYRDGHLFFVTENSVWLTEAVPADYLIWEEE